MYTFQFRQNVLVDFTVPAALVYVQIVLTVKTVIILQANARRGVIRDGQENFVIKASSFAQNKIREQSYTIK